MLKIQTFFKRTLATILMVGLFLPFMPKPANAVLGVGDAVIVVADTSPTGITNNVNHQLQHLKDFVLDRLATLIAKQILHQMTVSVVNWINSGFQGSPAFLTNPEGFFLDVADQVTGAFISESGALSSLCSPFSLDLRLGLALGQTTLVDQRYKCTLSTIIQNAKNAHVGVTVVNDPNGMTIGDILNGDVSKNPNAISVNGVSVDDTGDFLSGNFGNGGWPAFVALTTEPQNNQFGAYLQARSDLQQRIAQRQASLNTDLNRGNGFLSWKKCETIGSAHPADTLEIDRLTKKTANDPTVKQTIDASGYTKFESCTTQTPGSVISGTLQKQLNVPADELELANDINAVVNALMSQMVTTMLSQGLGALSGSAGGGRVSFTAQLQSQTNALYTEDVSRSQLQATGMTSDAISTLTLNKTSYTNGVNLLTTGKNSIIATRSCLDDKLNVKKTVRPAMISTFNSAISDIDNLVSTADLMIEAITIQLNRITPKLEQLQKIDKESLSSSHLGSPAELQMQEYNYQQAIMISAEINSNAQTSNATAAQDLTAAQEHSKKMNDRAGAYRAICENIGF